VVHSSSVPSAGVGRVNGTPGRVCRSRTCQGGCRGPCRCWWFPLRISRPRAVVIGASANVRTPPTASSGSRLAAMRSAGPGGNAGADGAASRRRGWAATGLEGQMTFLDCPAYFDEEGSVRCGLPAEVEDRYTQESAGGPLDSAEIMCPRGHWFHYCRGPGRLPVDTTLTSRQKRPAGLVRREDDNACSIHAAEIRLRKPRSVRRLRESECPPSLLADPDHRKQI
jgi:hypothetical protein